ncbi:MAG: alpha/beta fold hydrolase [Spirochaetales bacterium]|nr:alpha/beta fold hydrolase [Spirochaetales bacterium]
MRPWRIVLSIVMAVYIISHCAAPATTILTSYGNMESVRLMLRHTDSYWNELAGHMQEIALPSSFDGKLQRMLFYNPGGNKPRPLLIGLHSWSSTYKQSFSIPYAQWAQDNDWILVLPDYRGRFQSPYALSDAAEKDVIDAMSYAYANARVDKKKVYLTGYSGGATMGLLLAARHPDLLSAIAVWSPIYDLTEWYNSVRRRDWHYPDNVERICGGNPLRSTRAHESCTERSPANYLDRRKLKDLHIFLATGLDDNFVPPIHSIWSYNRLVSAEHAISENPAQLIGDIQPSGELELFGAAGADILLSRDRERKALRIYRGRHDVIYNAALQWLSGKTRRADEPPLLKSTADRTY